MASCVGPAAFSGRGEIPHRRYLRASRGSPRAPAWPACGRGVSRSGAIPEPTVTVRMKESATSRPPHAHARGGRGLVRPDSGNRLFTRTHHESDLPHFLVRPPTPRIAFVSRSLAPRHRRPGAPTPSSPRSAAPAQPSSRHLRRARRVRDSAARQAPGAKRPLRRHRRLRAWWSTAASTATSSSPGAVIDGADARAARHRRAGAVGGAHAAATSTSTTNTGASSPRTSSPRAAKWRAPAWPRWPRCRVCRRLDGWLEGRLERRRVTLSIA